MHTHTLPGQDNCLHARSDFSLRVERISLCSPKEVGETDKRRTISVISGGPYHSGSLMRMVVYPFDYSMFPGIQGGL